MHNADTRIYWRVSKANAAQLAILFAAACIAPEVLGIAPVWSVLPFVTTLLFGGWWVYRWFGDRRLAQTSLAIHTTHHTASQTHVQPPTTPPRPKPSQFYLPDTPQRLERLDTRF